MAIRQATIKNAKAQKKIAEGLREEAKAMQDEANAFKHANSKYIQEGSMPSPIGNITHGRQVWQGGKDQEREYWSMYNKADKMRKSALSIERKVKDKLYRQL